MDYLDSISELIRTQFDARTAARDQALAQARAAVRASNWVRMSSEIESR